MTAGRAMGAILSSALTGCPSAPNAPNALEGTGEYTYDGYAPLAATPLRVLYHVPARAGPLAPIVIVLHGDDRDAEAYRDAWIAKADRYGLIIAAPEFLEEDFPGSSGYALGNVFVDGNDPRPEEENDPAVWTFSVIGPLWEDLRTRTGNLTSIYHLFGHSAGAQFAHRLVQFLPEEPLGYALAANAGWYTVPDDAVAFPYGLGESPLEGGERAFFREALVVLAGSEDTDPYSANLRHTPEADAQGAHRLARAVYFVQESAELATAAGEANAWSFVEVEGVGHDHARMGEAAADWLAAALGI